MHGPCDHICNNNSCPLYNKIEAILTCLALIRRDVTAIQREIEVIKEEDSSDEDIDVDIRASTKDLSVSRKAKSEGH